MVPTFDNPGEGDPVLPPRDPAAARPPGAGHDEHTPPPPGAGPGEHFPPPSGEHAPPAAAEPGADSGEHRSRPALDPVTRDGPDDFAAPPPSVAPMTARRDQAFELADDPDFERGRMSFLEHLEELRWVLMHSIIATVVGAIAGWLLAPRVLEDSIRRTVQHAVVMSPLEAFNERFKLALIIGLFIALPIVLYKIWGFILPGLFRRERKWVVPMALMSLVLFAGGAAAAYFYVVPMVIHVLANFMTPSMVAQIRLGSLLGFVYNMALACGLVCQLPLVTMTLTAIGLVTPAFLLKQWRYAIVGTFLVTALITPGDVVTAQIVMGVPMTLLYFLSVGLSYFVARRKHEAAAAGEELRATQP